MKIDIPANPAKRKALAKKTLNATIKRSGKNVKDIDPTDYKNVAERVDMILSMLLLNNKRRED